MIAMENGRFQVIFDKLSAAVIRTETMTATIRIERSDADELDELRRLAAESAQPEPQTYTTA
ncbi:MAG: hypothetical protein ABI565_10485 [Vicinamibacteria bacterium]